MTGFFPSLPPPANLTTTGDGPSGLEIGPPAALDRRAWRMLLPQAAAGVDPCRVLVATLPAGEVPGAGSDVGRRVVGAVAATEHHVTVPRRGPRVLPHVIAPLRRRGIGRALVDAMAGHVRAAAAVQGRDPEVLYAWTVLDPASAEAAACRGLGFNGQDDVWVHELDLRASEAWLRPARERVAAAVPADARIIRLEEATAGQKEQIAALHVAHLGGRPQEMRALIAGPNARFRPQSSVLLRGERVIGFSLSRATGEPHVIELEANVIEPAHRMGWANILLRHEAARRLIEAGVTKVRFQTFEHHADSRGFARRTGDTVTHRFASLFRPLASG